uniref:Uncharacterized protein n=1 Tax=Rhodnius prolixus TaxID=13249 RepID=T1I8H1_RHOPR
MNLVKTVFQEDVFWVKSHFHYKQQVQVPKDSEKNLIKLATKSYAKFANGKEIDWVQLKEILDEELGQNLTGTGIISKALKLFSTTLIVAYEQGKKFKTARETIDHHASSGVEVGFGCHGRQLAESKHFRLWRGSENTMRAAVFESYDKAKTGYLEPFGLNEALKSAGFKLNNQVRNALCHRYASSDGRIRFDDFLMCAIKLDTLINNFRNKDPNNTNEAKFSLEEWVAIIVYF